MAVPLLIQVWVPATVDLPAAKSEVEAIAYRLGCERTRTMIEWEGHGMILIEVRCGEAER